jgi:hypothetical protein
MPLLQEENCASVISDGCGAVESGFVVGCVESGFVVPGSGGEVGVATGCAVGEEVGDEVGADVVSSSGGGGVISIFT